MKTSKRIIFLVILLAVALALPTTALASKKVFKARLTPGAELHTVVGSTATGGFVLIFNADGSMNFRLNIRNLSGPATGVHLHGPASASETAGVLIPICGSSSSVTGAECPFDSGNLVLEGTIRPRFLADRGVDIRDFQNWLVDGLIYINAHTSLNPAGETRGQLYEQL